MTDRERCYPILRSLQEDGLIDRYIAAQHPISRRWGFKIATTPDMPDDERYFFLPREALAFAEGVKVTAARVEAAEADAERERVARRAVDQAFWERVRENDRREFDESGKARVTDPNEPQ